MLTLFHGTLREHLPAIMEHGIERGEGWGGAGTSGVFLSRTPEGALYWAKMAYQREYGEKLEVTRFDRDHGAEIDDLLAVLVVEIPDEVLDRLRADEEQFEDVGADFSPDDWRRSLEVIGDVRFDGEIPWEWIREILQPSGIEAQGGRRGLAGVKRGDILGLTELGVQLYLAQRAIYKEIMVPVGEEAGELLYDAETVEQFAEAMLRKWEALWTERGIDYDPLYAETVAEFVDKPVPVDRVARRLAKRGTAKSPSAVVSAIEYLISQGVLTEDLENVWVASRVE